MTQLLYQFNFISTSENVLMIKAFWKPRIRRFFGLRGVVCACTDRFYSYGPELVAENFIYGVCQKGMWGKKATVENLKLCNTSFALDTAFCMRALYS
jgi:hypothetical protein